MKGKEKMGKKAKITGDHVNDNKCFYISDPACNQGGGHRCTPPSQLKNCFFVSHGVS